MKDESKINFQWKVNEYLSGFVKFADQKASYIIAFFGIIAPVFTTLVFTSKLCSTQKFIFGGIGALGFLIPILLLFFVYRPRTPKEENGLIFWENILQYKLEEYTKAIGDATDETLLNEVSKQNYNLSKVLDRKFGCMKWIVIVGVCFLLYYVIATICILAS